MAESKVVSQSTKKPKPKVTKEKATQSKRKKAFGQKPKKLITLKEYMPLQFRDESLTLIPCYQIKGDGENNDNIDQVAFQAGDSSVVKIHFFDKDLLLGSTPHNRPLFVVGYIYE